MGCAGRQQTRAPHPARRSAGRQRTRRARTTRLATLSATPLTRAVVPPSTKNVPALAPTAVRRGDGRMAAAAAAGGGRLRQARLAGRACLMGRRD